MAAGGVIQPFDSIRFDGAPGGRAEGVQAAHRKDVGRAIDAYPDSGWQDVDLRIKGAAEPVENLRRLLDRYDVWKMIIRAEHQARDGNNLAAHASMAEALRLSHRWAASGAARRDWR
jgi:hypothetical protein